jgi:ribonuclease G
LDRELLIAAGPAEWRAALLEDGVCVELFVERGDRNEAGSIHLGRVRRLVPALGAVLVDIEEDRPAFLPQGGIVPRGSRLDEGERVLVQIHGEARGGKATRVTMAIALRGLLVELTPGRPGLKGGERLTLEGRNRLLAVLETLTHPALRAGSRLSRVAGEGADPRIVVRGEAGEGSAGLRLFDLAPLEALAAEAVTLAQRWHDILDRAARLVPPVRLDPPTTFAAALANALRREPRQISVDDPAAVPEIRAAFRGSAVRQRPEAEWPADLDALFEAALSETVAVDGGGSVHIEATRAAVLIDVDTGTPETGSPQRTALAVNLAASAKIARQIRLRNLGGGIIVDFVGLDSRASRERVRAAFAEALAPDPAEPQILGWTRLGHLELVRPRGGRPLVDAMLERRPGGALVKTAVTVAHEALRALRREARAQPGRQWRLIVAPDVRSVLTGALSCAVREAEQRFARKIVIETIAGCDRERFQISML